MNKKKGETRDHGTAILTVKNQDEILNSLKSLKGQGYLVA